MYFFVCVCLHATTTRFNNSPNAKIMIFITFKSYDKACSKIEKNLNRNNRKNLVHRVTRNSKMNWKI